MSTTEEQRPAETILVDVGDFFANRTARPNQLYRIGGKSLAMSSMTSSLPYVDESAMSARFTISTATVDRVGDMLMPMGCNLENYAKNPVVLWAHGIEGLSTPIGTSNDPNGNLTVIKSKDEVQATWFCAQSDLAACQIFELTAKGIIKACSVRETPIRSRMVMHEGQQILLVDEWELEEWSPCAIGVNPDAVAKAIHTNKLGGQPIVESVMKSLMAVAPEKRVLGVGLPEFKFSPDQARDDHGKCTDEGKRAANATSRAEEASGKTDGKKNGEFTSPKDLAKHVKDKVVEHIKKGPPSKASHTAWANNHNAIAKDHETMAASSSGDEKKHHEEAADAHRIAAEHHMRAAAAAPEKKSMSKDDAETPADEAQNQGDPGQQPYGAQAIAAFHHGISSQVKCAEKCMGAMEHPKATPSLRKAIDTVKDVATELKGIHAECYPNCTLKDDMGDEDSDDTDSEMKAFLASGQRYQFQIVGVSASIKSMASEKNLTPAQRKQLIEIAGGIDRLTTQAKSFQPKPAVEEKKPDLSPEAQAKLDEAYAKLTQS